MKTCRYCKQKNYHANDCPIMVKRLKEMEGHTMYKPTFCECGNPKAANKEFCPECQKNIGTLRAQCVALDAVFGVLFGGGFPANTCEEERENEGARYAR